MQGIFSVSASNETIDSTTNNNNNNNNNNTVHPQCLLSLRIPNYTTHTLPSIAPPRTAVGLTFQLPPLTRRGTSFKHTVQ
jgi:hypothetical protein